METKQIQKIIEAALLAAGNAVSLDQLMGLFGLEDRQPAREEVRSVLEDISDACADRGYELKQVASGYRFQVKQEFSPWVSRLWDEKPQKYSRALLETLAIIAYRQPMTRGEIEEIRGVSVSTNITKTLLEREWVRVVGHRDVPGKPALFATTKQFLDYFNLKRLDELPTLKEIRDLAEFEPELEFSGEENAKEIEAESHSEELPADEVADFSENAEEVGGSGESAIDEQLIDAESFVENKTASSA